MADATNANQNQGIMANSILFYNNGIFATRGYATPFLSPANLTTCNRDVKYLVNTFGQLLSGIMQMPDVWVAAAPPRIFLQTVAKAVDRFRTIVAARMNPDGQNSQRPASIAPTQEPFLIFPVPYFYVRNPYATQWCWDALMALSEAMKHHTNAYPRGISSDLASIMSQYTEDIYRQIAIELLGKTPPAALPNGSPAPVPTLVDADYASYSPATVFSAVERADQGAPLSFQLPSEALGQIANGIPATQIYSQLADPPGAVVSSIANPSGMIAASGTNATASASVAAPPAVVTPNVPPPPAP